MQAQKQEEKEAKQRLRSIADQMKGSDKLPGLLAFCGEWVKRMQTYKDVAEFKKSAASVDAAKPVVILDVPGLRAEEASAGARVNFSMFKVLVCLNRS